jgi:hypothetical protein
LVVAVVALPGCLIPPPLETQVEVIRPEDSEPLLGETPRVRLASQEWPVAWDSVGRRYVGHAYDSEEALRIARLQGDVYLFQATRDLNHYLIPVRIRPSGEAMPLACQSDADLAATYGVSIRPAGEFNLSVGGDRPGILGFLLATLDRCTPLLKVEGFALPSDELAGDAAPAGHRPSWCRPCPRGPGACVWGSVRDRSGAVIPGATIQVTPVEAGAATAATSDDNGAFTITGIPEGTYEFSAGLTGFVTMTTPPFRVHPGASYVFEDPFELPVAGPAGEVIRVLREPIECR